MNRKQVLKNAKNKKKEKINNEEENYFNRLVGILAFTLIIIILGYLFIGIFVNKTITFGDKKDKEETEVTIDNTTILAGEIFDQKEDSYYVLIFMIKLIKILYYQIGHHIILIIMKAL